MAKGNRKTIFSVLALIGIVTILPLSARAQTLAPRLLWQKALPFEASDVVMASQSGDIILYSKEARQIILYDKNGNKRFHWGPRVDRKPIGVDISHDGSIIVYETSWTEDYVERKKIDLDQLGWDRRIHYVNRQGKELWNKKILGTACLSPDGKMIAIGKSAGEGRDLTLLDQNGNLLWRHGSRETRNIVFSSDSNYILFSGEGGLQLLDKSGNPLWAKNEEKGAITSGAAYVVTEKRVYDKQGNIVTEILGSDIIIADDNTKAVYVYPDKVNLLTWPNKTVLKEYIFTFSGATAISRDGHYMVVGGKSAASSNNLFIFDTAANTSWETKIDSKFYFLLTDDGKYLLIVRMDINQILYYQLY